MAEYIEREAAERAAHMAFVRRNDALQYSEMIHQLAKIPAADVRPVVLGKWATVYDDFMKSNYDTCSCCGKEYFGANGFNFCPNCGADMREES